MTVEPSSPSTGTLRPLPPSGNPVNLPNAITISRLVLAIVLFALIDIDGWWRLSAVLFIIAALTDILDGFLARKYGQVTVLGRILDPFVDKIIICGAFIFLQGQTSGELTSGVNAWMSFIIVAREMFITSLRAFLEQHGRDFSAQWTGKVKMGLQCVTVPFAILSLSHEFLQDLPSEITPERFFQIRDLLLWSTIAVTIYSGVEYSWRAVQAWRTPSPSGDPQ